MRCLRGRGLPQPLPLVPALQVSVRSGPRAGCRTRCFGSPGGLGLNAPARPGRFRGLVGASAPGADYRSRGPPVPAPAPHAAHVMGEEVRGKAGPGVSERARAALQRQGACSSAGPGGTSTSGLLAGHVLQVTGMACVSGPILPAFGALLCPGAGGLEDWAGSCGGTSFREGKLWQALRGGRGAVLGSLGVQGPGGFQCFCSALFPLHCLPPRSRSMLLGQSPAPGLSQPAAGETGGLDLAPARQGRGFPAVGSPPAAP